MIFLQFPTLIMNQITYREGYVLIEYIHKELDSLLCNIFLKFYELNKFDNVDCSLMLRSYAISFAWVLWVCL